MSARTEGSVTKGLKRSCEMLGVKPKGTHAFRRFMVTTCREGGANPDVLRTLAHGGGSRDVLTDSYTRWPWAARCEAVMCLKLKRPTFADVVDLPVAVGQSCDASGFEPLFPGGADGTRSLVQPCLAERTKVRGAARVHWRLGPNQAQKKDHDRELA